MSPSALRRQIGQLLIAGFNGHQIPPELRSLAREFGLGGVILFARNIAEPEQVAEVAFDAARLLPDLPAWVSVDQEGGRVARLKAPFTEWPPMATLGRSGDVTLAERFARALAAELKAVGISLDFAPVLDVHTNPANPIIGDRAFGTDAEAVARRALAFARGLDAAGVIACGKHFPGHGDTATDSHLELPRIDHGWDRLERVELLPFRRAAAAGMPMIMTAHVVFAALDPDHPATLSPEVVTGLLRGRLGYRGVVVSDDLDMQAIAGHLGAGAAAVAAIRAGCDVVLACKDEAHQAEAEAALIREAESDGELRRRIGEAAARVRALKLAHAAARAARPAPGREVVGSAAHLRLAERLATG
jgi:beta-N-acetylhexosaminidase